MKNITQGFFNYFKGYVAIFGLLITSSTLLSQPYIQTNSSDGLGQYGYLEKNATTFTTLNSGAYGNIYQLFTRTFLNGTDILTYGAALNSCSGSGVVQVTNDLNFGANAIAGQTANTSIHADYCGGANSYGANPNQIGFNERHHFIFQVTDKPADISPNVKYNGGKTVVLSFKLEVGGVDGKFLNRLWIQNDGTISESTEIANDGFKIYYEAVTGSETFDGSETNAAIYGDYASNPANNNQYGNDALAIPIPLTGLRCYVVLEKFNTCVESGKTVQVSIMNDGISLTPNMDSSFSLARINKTPSSNTAVAVLGGATTYIPDDNFEQALITLGLDCNLDDYVFTSNISDVVLLDIRDRNITSLVGINDFTNLEKLYCNNDDVSVTNNNAITVLDVSSLSKLRYFYCQNNQITNLNISGLTKLEALDTSNNPFLSTTLDVHSNPNLYYLVCQNNGLADLNISGLTKLQTLIVWVNQLASLDVSNNPDLTYLDCDENFFTDIIINGLTKLEYFYCSYNELSTIDVSGSTNLIEFYCNNNLLSSLDLKGLTSLDYFDCTANTLPMCILVDDVPAATAKTTAGQWAKDGTANYSYCNCDLTTTWNGISWDNGTPTTGTYAAIIAGNYSQLANISACSLTITNNAVVTIPSGYNVTLNAPLKVEAGSSFTLNNKANLVQTNKNSINEGAINVNRDSSPLFRLDYTMWSSPVSGTQTLGGFSPLTDTNRFYEYNAATDLYNAVSSTDPFGLAKGYLIRMPNTWVDYVVSPPSTPLAWTGAFMGLPNNGDVSLAVSNGTYNAIGNPYPSTISADAFITDNGITEALYFWRKKNNENQATAPTTSYATYTLAGGAGTGPSTLGGITPNGTIQVGQGFIAKSTSTTLKFTNAMRTANNSNQILRTKAVERNRIWLNLTNPAGAFNQMMVAYMTGATQDIDAAIDGRYFNDSPTALNSLINSEEFAIQGRVLPFDGTDIVPLAFKTNLAGDYTIAIDHVDGLFSGNQDVFLKDNNTGTETNLKAGAYTFIAAAGVDNARFSLKYQKTLGVNNAVFNDDSVTIHKNKGTLYVNSGAMAINNIKVFDIQGRLIVEQKNVKSNTATIKDLKATQQVLIVKITSQDNKVVSKKVVN